MKLISTIAGLACLFTTSALAKVPGPLVTAEWLAANMKSVVVLDVRKDTNSYMDKGHIPGARLVDFKKVNGKMEVMGVELKEMAPSAEAFSALMKASGISNDSSIVITSIGDNTNQITRATRLYWVLKYFGHNDVALLDGGTAKWTADKHELSSDFEDDNAGSFQAGAPHEEIRATTSQVMKASASGSDVIFDARGLDQYIGLRKSGFVTAAGRVPNAVLASTSIFLSKKGPKTFMGKDKIVAALGAVNANGNSIAYCNSGQYSSALWFMMHELAGNKKARLYDGSMHAWSKTGQKTVQ